MRKYFSVIDLFVYIFFFFFFNVLVSIASQHFIPAYAEKYGVENLNKIMYIPIFLLIVISSRIYRRYRCIQTQSPCRFISNGPLNPTSILLGMVLMIAVSVITDPLVGYFKADLSSYLEKFTSGSMWVTLFVTVIVAPILEELFFRGVILKDIATTWGPRWGILLSSLVFSLLHFNFVQIIPAFLMGIVMGYIYIYTRRGIINVIFVHIINNLTASVSMYWGFGEVSVWERYLSDGVWYKIVFGVSAILVLLLLVRVATLSNKSITHKTNV